MQVRLPRTTHDHPGVEAEIGGTARFVVRIDPNLRKKAALLAVACGASPKQYFADAIERAS